MCDRIAMRKNGQIHLVGNTVYVYRVTNKGLRDKRSKVMESPYHTAMYQDSGMDALRKEATRYVGGLRYSR